MFIWPGSTLLWYEHVKMFHSVFQATRAMQL